jgi:DNA segregation ATPase FtsK/SpoIIIE-like protein
MSVSYLRRGRLNRQANRLERALGSLSLPVRVEGGQILSEWVRYHLAPLSDDQVYRVWEMADQVAEAVGVYRVRVTESENGLALDLPADDEESVRLLTLLQEVSRLQALTMVVGLRASGEPLIINLRRSSTWHVVICGSAGVGKSELLRTMILSSAFSSRQSQLQFLGIDLRGNELSVIDSLPHRLAEVATDADYAVDLLRWLIKEMDRREKDRARFPDIVLAIDEITEVHNHQPQMEALLERICRDGRNTGIHLFIGSRSPDVLRKLSVRRGPGVVLGISRGSREKGEAERRTPGEFEFRIDDERIPAQVAWLPLRDIQRAVDMLQEGWRPSIPEVDSRKLW